MYLVVFLFLEVWVVLVVNGLFVVDVWFDMYEFCLFFVIVVMWYDDDIDESFVEGCVVVLFDVGCFWFL